MVMVLQGSTGTKGRTDWKNKNLGYKYTKYNNRELDLRPGHDLHDDLLKRVMSMAHASKRVMGKRYKEWRDIDRTLRAYMSLDSEEQLIKDKDNRKPVGVVIPQSYAIRETILAYFVAAFLEGTIFKYKPRSKEDVVGAALLEMVVQQQMEMFKAGLELHTMWGDSIAYGIGMVAMDWEQVTGMVSVRSDDLTTMERLLAVMQGNTRGITTKEKVLYEGNKMVAIDPYKAFLDTNTPIHRMQSGAFVGWVERTTYNDLLDREYNRDDYFNVKYLKEGQSDGVQWKSKYFGDDIQDDRKDRDLNKSSETISGVTVVDLIHMYVRVSPTAWKLGNKDKSEIWLVTVAGDELTVRAKPLGRNHNMFPVGICSTDYDGHSTSPISRLEVTYSLQVLLDFLLKSHVSNVRKFINDTFVVNPQLINTKDMVTGKPGGIFRLRQSAWARPGAIKDAIQQLQVNNYTESHIPFAQVIAGMTEKYSGALDSLQGVRRNTSERVSATEFQGLQGAGVNKIEKMARIVSLQAHTDLAFMAATNTQELMTENMYMQVVGRYAEELIAEYGDEYATASPRDIVVPFDTVLGDGSVPSSEFAQTWVNLFQIMSSQPQIARKFDMTRVFMHVARLAGAKNVTDFVIKGGQVDPSIVADEDVKEMEAQGKLKALENQSQESNNGG